MKSPSWTREETMAAFSLYCKIPFGKIHHGNPAIIDLASMLGRTPGAVAWKLSNLASFDKTLQARNIRGAQNASKLDKIMWDEFEKDESYFIEQCEQAYRFFQTKAGTVVTDTDIAELETTDKNTAVKRLITTRLNQRLFRTIILATYENRCWISGINIPELLIASHIIPWSVDVKNRLNPRNGICLNALFDKAFDAGLLTITPDYSVVVSRLVKQDKKADYINSFDGIKMQPPVRFTPDPDFLAYHNKYLFVR